MQQVELGWKKVHRLFLVSQHEIERRLIGPEITGKHYRLKLRPMAHGMVQERSQHAALPNAEYNHTGIEIFLRLK